MKKLITVIIVLVSVSVSAQTPMKFAYDALSRLTNVTYGSGASASYTYDAVGNLTSVTHADGSVVRYTYDPNDNNLSQTLEEKVAGVLRKSTKSYTYDRLNRLSTMTFPEGVVVGYTHDPVGNILSQKVVKPPAGVEWVTREQAEQAMMKIRPAVMNHPDPMVREGLQEWIKSGKVQLAATSFLSGMSASLEQDGKTRQVLLWYSVKFVSDSTPEQLKVALSREATRVQNYMMYATLTPPKK